MSEYGVKITNFEAGSIYEVMLGVRNNYDTQPAMLTNSLFSDFMKENGLSIYKETSTRDIICIEFNYGSRAYEDEKKHLEKLIKKISEEEGAEEKLQRVKFLLDECNNNKDKFEKKSADDIRTLFYTNGVQIKYPKFNRQKEIVGYDCITYRMLFRTPGKAKKGSCMFIKNSLYKKAHDFLWMGLKLPKKNSPIVEIGAYSSLITSSVVDRIQINPENILILNDVDSPFVTDVISVEIDETKKCIAKKKENYKLKNTLFDGQALIDSSIFPDWADGYILLRQHFTKMAAFSSNIQLFFKDYFKDKYDTAVVVDMWGNEHLAKDIKLITTDNAIKWKKFDVSYEYWCDRVHQMNDMFGIVKTAHPSKLGDVQRMSYQMVNALSEDIMDDVLARSKDYIWKLKTDDSTFFEYLRRASNFSNDYDVLVALCEQNPKFTQCDYYRERKNEIIRTYVKDLKNGRTIQNADNLTIVGSPYAMLLHSVGEDPTTDPTFGHEDGTIQCWTERFEDGEYLAEFRNPFNSRNNLGYIHNHHHEYFDKYFNLGRLCIAINMINTDFQDRNNGSDQDSDSIYTTNQPQIVEHAQYCYENYPTVVNNIPKDSNHYDNKLEDFAAIDNKLAAAQLDIGESSNLAQICLTYSYNFNDPKIDGYICILAVLAQVAIDRAKRNFDVNIQEEIKRIKVDINLKDNKHPAFWLAIRKNYSVDNINWKLRCPMNSIYNIKLKSYNQETPTLPMREFFIKHPYQESKRTAKKFQRLIEEFAFDLYNLPNDDDSSEEYFLLKSNFEDLIQRIRELNLGDKYLGFMSYLIDRAFMIVPQTSGKKDKMISTMNKNKSILLKTLYEVNPKTLLKCFKNEQ